MYRMAKKEVTIEFNIRQLQRDIEHNVKKAKKKLLKRMLEDTTPFVPMKTGNLRDSGQVTEDGLEWTADYASHVYYGLQPHAIGTREWFEAAKIVHEKQWMKQFQKDINQGG